MEATLKRTESAGSYLKDVCFPDSVDIFTLRFCPAVSVLLGAPPGPSTDSGLGWKGSTPAAASSRTGTCAGPSPWNSDPRKATPSVLGPSAAMSGLGGMLRLFCSHGQAPAGDPTLIGASFLFCQGQLHRLD